MDPNPISHKVVIPYGDFSSSGVIGSRAALDLVRNSRLRSSCPLVNSQRQAENSISITSRTFSTPSRGRTQNHRRAIIPITSRQTSRVLNNLDMDCVSADVQIKENYPAAQVSSFRGLDSNSNRPKIDHKNNSMERASTESVESLNSNETSRSQSSDQFQLEGVSGKDWTKIRSPMYSHRYSASSFGSSASEDDIWVPRSSQH